MSTRARPGTVVTEVARADNAAYMRLWRQRRSDRQSHYNQKNTARQVAALIVANAHPEEFARALEAEQARRGLA